MFFRIKHSLSGQCLQLLESFRNSCGLPRQKVVVSLGDASIPETLRPLIARMIEQRLYNQTSLLPQSDDPLVLKWVDCIAKRIDREGRWKPAPQTPSPAINESNNLIIDGVVAQLVNHTHTTSLGPSLLAWEAWNRLGMPEFLKKQGFNLAQAQTAATSVINRLVDPGSERALLDWLPDSCLPELMGMEITQAGKDRFYRISDQLMKHRQAIEEHLRDMQGKLFEVERTMLLYDLTNSYFEGEALKNPKAKRGKSKEKRDDCPQVVLGVIFDQRGFELAHRVFEGNQNDGKSLVHMIQEMDTLVPRKESSVSGKPSLVLLDGGIATRSNLALLQSKQICYLVNDSRRGRKMYQKEFSQRDQFTVVCDRQNKSQVKVCKMVDPLWNSEDAEEGPSADENQAGVQEKQSTTGCSQRQADTLVLCWSQGRDEKESAIRSNAEAKYLAALEKLRQRVEKGKLKEKEKIQRAIGRLQQQHVRVQRYYQVELTEQSPDRRLEWKRDEEKHQSDEELMGCYVLRTNYGKGSAQEIWNAYMTLSKAEEGFRMLKGDLGLRPNYHQIEERVDGHIWITIMAYHLLSWIRETLREKGDNRSWETIRRIMQTHCYTTIVMPTRGGKTYRIRKAGEPEEMQKAIYRRLGVDWAGLPQTRTVAEGGAIL